ncbi:hypothetical protein D3C86_679390 [compost metagenome]
MGARLSADPRPPFGVATDVDAALASEAGALSRHISALGVARVKEPVPHRGIQATRDGIFDDRPLIIGEEGA